MSDLDTIFRASDDVDLFNGVRNRIFETKCGHLEPYESYSKRLSEGERIVILVNSFIWEVSNGGFSQYLGNSSGDLSEETLVAMRTIGATSAVDALEDARVVIFGGSTIPSDRDVRCDILSQWEEQDEERTDAFYDKHNLGWCKPVQLAVSDYIRGHREMFT